ncbi:MAG: hypothetical protein RLZZ298_958 [Pseudomonadota bacterium]|jgi:uncharacterized repeat protein (TIGR03837 family)
MALMQRNWDIFCRVIDNYGDIGVCWRLARQLVKEYGLNVRLWVDEPASLALMCQQFNLALPAQFVDGVEVCHWAAEFPEVKPANVVIEAFACELPRNYLQAMALTEEAPCWINLDYLTAEPWAESCHGMTSPHPALPLVKYFFFPGFTVASGGLIREADLRGKRNAFAKKIPGKKQIEISLFCYESAPVGQLIDLLADSPLPVLLHLPPGKPFAAVTAYLGGYGPWQLGNLNIVAIPFVHQDQYDQLLWRCDFNFVRGEDSFVRALWAGHPFIWQIYEQEADAHLIKLNAFLERYTEGLSKPEASAIHSMFMAWNTGHGLKEAWLQFIDLRGEITDHAEKWSKDLSETPDLAANLVKFCGNRL